jgi:hypothetical protein
MMRQQLNFSCPDHDNPMDCPDAVVVKMRNGDFGLPVRDGENSNASSYIVINFCPWCGAGLPRTPKAREG